jgi:hypothetical protein
VTSKGGFSGRKLDYEFMIPIEKTCNWDVVTEVSSTYFSISSPPNFVQSGAPKSRRSFCYNLHGKFRRGCPGPRNVCGGFLIRYSKFGGSNL